MYYEFLSGFSDEISCDVDTQFRVMNKLGIRYYEPRGIGEKNISQLNDEEVLALKAKMDEYGMKASSIGSPIGKIDLSEDFEAHFELFKRVVRTAHMLGTRYIRMFSFHNKGKEWNEESRALVLERLGRLIEYAKAEDVVLLHENEKNIYGDTADHCLDLMKALSCDHFKQVFDPANFVQCGEDTKEAYEKLKGYVAYVHIKDARKETGSIVPAGHGDGNVAYVLRELFKAGYHGFISLEPHLGKFKGLAQLEGDCNIMKDLPEGGEGTFTLAYEALKKIIEEEKR